MWVKWIILPAATVQRIIKKRDRKSANVSLFRPRSQKSQFSTPGAKILTYLFDFMCMHEKLKITAVLNKIWNC